MFSRVYVEMENPFGQSDFAYGNYIHLLQNSKSNSSQYTIPAQAMHGAMMWP